MTKTTPWTPAENAALVRLYFTMLDSATAGRPYNKAAMIREVQTYRQNEQYYGLSKPLADSGRSRGSIEAKLMNASAAHAKLRPSATTMDGFGYRALANYQAALGEAMLHELERRDRQALDGHQSHADAGDCALVMAGERI